MAGLLYVMTLFKSLVQYSKRFTFDIGREGKLGTSEFLDCFHAILLEPTSCGCRQLSAAVHIRSSLACPPHLPSQKFPSLAAQQSTKLQPPHRAPRPIPSLRRTLNDDDDDGDGDGETLTALHPNTRNCHSVVCIINKISRPKPSAHQTGPDPISTIIHQPCPVASGNPQSPKREIGNQPPRRQYEFRPCQPAALPPGPGQQGRGRASQVGRDRVQGETGGAYHLPFHTYIPNLPFPMPRNEITDNLV